MEETIKQLPYAIWTVKGVDYKLKLTTSGILECEQKLGCNLLELINNIEIAPKLSVMLLIVHKAMTKFNHGIGHDDLIKIYDDYIEEGGNQIAFMTKVFLPIFRASGFLPKKAGSEMGKQLQEVEKAVA